MHQELNTDQLTQVGALAWTWAAAILPRLVTALLILIAGIALANWAQRAVSRFLGRAQHLDPTVRPFLAAALRYALLVLVIVAALEQLGVQATSLLAVLGAAGLAIGLALQGTLSNIAAGLMLLWLRPFHVGEFIEVPSVAGVAGWVREIGLFVCQLETFDGLFLFVPNSALWNAPLKNHSRNLGRVLSLAVVVPATADRARARQALLDAATQDQRILKTPEPAVFIDNVSGGNLVLNLVCWTTPAGAGTVQRGIIERVERGLAALGPDFAASTVTRLVPPDTDPSRLMTSADG
ncbi:MAG TPA: mechanosensitive ion channel [Stellaceae bacterium]|nr:mechanosensitive ion channel [Stellaceae bacterium]